MGAVHFGAGAEVKVPVVVRIQYGFKAGLRRNADRAGRKAVIPVRVVRGFNLQMLFQNPVQAVVIAEGNGRVRLLLRVRCAMSWGLTI